ncbi:type II secretion system protein M [Gammaproteobacteria bacterium]|nr:type II secretion system protein M [Gammaproteobacteria bacterium]
MNQWWVNLSLKEKKTIKIGGITLSILLIYMLIWLPLQNEIKYLRSQIKQNQKLLSWMITADKKIQDSSKEIKASTNINSDSALSIVENEIHQNDISNKVTKLRQIENGLIELNFDQVSFDKLIAWLTVMWENHNLLVTQMNIKPSIKPGIVHAELKLKLF